MIPPEGFILETRLQISFLPPQRVVIIGFLTLKRELIMHISQFSGYRRRSSAGIGWSFAKRPRAPWDNLQVLAGDYDGQSS